MTKDKGKISEDNEESKDNNNVILPHQEVIDRNFVFRSQLKTQEIISELKANSSKRLSQGVLDLATNISETHRERNKNNWWNDVTNVRGKFNTLKSVVSEDEVQYYKLPEYASDYPYRRVYQMHRYRKTDDTDWLWVNEQFVGLTEKGSITAVSIDDSYTYVSPAVFWEEQTLEGSSPPQGDNITKQGIISRVPVIRSIPSHLGEIQGETVHTLKFTPENARSLFSMRAGPLGGKRDFISLAISKEGNIPSYGIHSIEDFCLPWDEIWDKVTAYLRVTTTEKEVKELARRLGIGADAAREELKNKDKEDKPYK